MEPAIISIDWAHLETEIEFSLRKVASNEIGPWIKPKNKSMNHFLNRQVVFKMDTPCYSCEPGTEFEIPLR
jgi:hypothetical protein